MSKAKKFGLELLKLYWKYRYVDKGLVVFSRITYFGLGVMGAGPFLIQFVLANYTLPAGLEVSHGHPVWLGLVIAVVGFACFVWRINALSKKTTGILILHRGMAGMDTSNPRSVLPRKMRIGHLDVVDFDDQAFQRDGSAVDPEGLLRKVNGLDEQLRTRRAEAQDATIAYAGLAPIPLLVAAGYRVTSRQPVVILDYDRTTGWHQLDELDDDEKFSISQPLEEPTQDVALALSMSATIPIDDIPGAIRNYCYVGTLAGGARMDSLSSDTKQSRICKELYNFLTSINARHPNAKGVHLFIASQASFAFRLGQFITQSVHLPARIYQYEGGRYTWSVQIEGGREPVFMPATD